MASVSESSTRANIRIEIKNDFSEEMEVDESEELNTLSEGEVEDGEISDDKANENVESQTKKHYSNRNVASNRLENSGGFQTGIDIFAEDEREKLQTRAQRFGINPTEYKSITDEQLQELHDSLGITENDEINTRFEAIHMYGTQEMSTQDIFGYFGKYDPATIEWINDESCNVVWLDKISAVRAFYGLSKTVDGMPVVGKCDPFQIEKEESKGRSILLVPKNTETSLEDKDSIHVSEINIPVPPGFWRLGIPHPKAKYILLRFAKRSDKKPIRAERFSEYYKKYGNPNYGGIRGLISESKKKRMKGLPVETVEEEVVSGNPWESLARNWNNDILERPTEENKLSSLTKVSKSIQNRLGSTNKRIYSSAEENESEETEKTKKSKVPRMRMYADEEEARIKKAKQMKKIRELEKIEERMIETVPDLRNRIGRHIVPTVQNPQPVKPEPKIISRPVVVRQEDQNISSDSEDEINVQQKSKVTVIVKKPLAAKPTVASTIWSRLDIEKRKQTNQIKINADRNKSQSESDSESSKSDSSDSESDTDNSAFKNKLSAAVNSRPGFNRDLKSRLGLNSDHKSPLRIEINNDHYKKA